MGFRLPPFADWTPEGWGTKGEEVSEIVEDGLGWDITDVGYGDYDKCGLFLFTLRNANPSDWNTMQGKLYAEKVMVVGVAQATLIHFRWRKTEDIINLGGGELVIQLCSSTEDSDLADTDVIVSTDGVKRVVKAGGTVVLSASESITLPQQLYHEFSGVGSQVLVGEVSTVNYDRRHNHFHKPVGRVPEIEEDEPPLYRLCGECSRYYHPKRNGTSACIERATT